LLFHSVGKSERLLAHLEGRKGENLSYKNLKVRRSSGLKGNEAREKKKWVQWGR